MIVVLKAPSLAERVAAHGGVAIDEAGAELDEQRARAAAAASLAARGAGRDDPAGLQLHARALGLLGGARRDARSRCSSATTRCRASTRCASRIPPRSRRPRSSADRSPPPSATPTSRSPATTAAASRSRCSTRASTGAHPSLRRQRRSRHRRRRPAGDATPAVAARPARSRSSATARRWRASSSATAARLRRTASRAGATVLPIRVAGWQPDGSGGFAVYARTDQLIAGLERAVDPNADGDAHDAARVALVGVAAPFAAFADDPAARAVDGALGLDTLVVVPAGNDGPAGPAFGSVAGPGGAPAALTVGAADTRARDARTSACRSAAGCDVVLDRHAAADRRAAARGLARRRSLAAPGLVHKRALVRADSTRTSPRRGLSLVAGRAALVPAGRRRRGPPAAPRAPARRRCSSTGARLPAGGVALDEDTPVPVVSVSSAVAATAARARSPRETTPAVSLGRAHTDDERGVADGRGLLVDRPRVRRPRQAGRRRARRRRRDAEPSASRRRDAALRHRERVERRGGGGRGRGGGARAGAARRCTPRTCAASSSTSARRLASETGRRARAPASSRSRRGGRRGRRRSRRRSLSATRPRAGWKRTQTVLVRNVSTRPSSSACARSVRAGRARRVEFHAFPSRFRLPGETRRVRISAARRRARRSARRRRRGASSSRRSPARRCTCRGP